MSGRDLLRAVAAAVVCVSALSLAGCATGGSDVLTAEEAAPRASDEATPHAREHTKQAEPVDAGGLSRREVDTYVAAARKQLPGLWSPQFRKMFSSIRINPVYPRGIEFVYVYKVPVDVAVASNYMDTQLPLLKAAFQTQIEPEMTSFGFQHPSAAWTYRNPDGTLVWSRTVS